jgi:hypothetical protein
MNQDEIDKVREKLREEIEQANADVARAFRVPPPELGATSGIPVRMSVGDSRPFEVGWIRNDEALPGLLRAIADEIERVQPTETMRCGIETYRIGGFGEKLRCVLRAGHAGWHDTGEGVIFHRPGPVP